MTPLNSDVFEINNDIVQKLEGSARQYLSFHKNDSDEVALKNAVPIEFLGFLEIEAVLMLLWNLNIKLDHLLVGKIITGRCKSQIVLLPRIKIISTDDESAFWMVRKHEDNFRFEQHLPWLLTKHTFEKARTYLRNKVFSHGQLYVAL